MTGDCLTEMSIGTYGYPIEDLTAEITDTGDMVDVALINDVRNGTALKECNILLKDSASFDIKESLRTSMLVLIGCQSMSSLVPSEPMWTLTEKSTLFTLSGLASW